MTDDLYGTRGWGVAEWSRLSPDEWPHTPPLSIFQELEAEDSNLFWRLSCGHHLNLFEAAVERIEDLNAAIDRLEGEDR